VQRADALPERVRQRGLTVLLATTFLSWGGFFAVVPLIAVHYVDQLGWTAASVGLVLAVRQFMQQGISSLTGAVADQIGPKPLMCFGMAIRVASFLLLAIADTYPLVMASAMLMAIGGGFNESPQAAATAALTTPANRQRYFALSGTAGGLGTSLGTQAGALLLGVNFATVALIGAAAFSVIFVVNLLFLPSISVSMGNESATAGLKLAIHDRLFIGFNVLLMGFWFMWTQFSISLPLVATDITGDTTAVAWVYGVNAGVTVLLGYLLPRLLERRMSTFWMLVAGIALNAIGMIAIGWAGSLSALLFCVFVLSIGMVLARPGQQTITAGLARPEALGAFMGIGSLSLAIGGGAGNFFGGVVYDLGVNRGVAWLPWVVFGTIGLASAIGLTQIRGALDRRQQDMERIAEAAEADAEADLVAAPSS
jgi:DHA1 family multidrug resistance protein-like MFS transporter